MGGLILERPIVFVCGVCLLIGGCAWGFPQYRVYQKRLDGEAELAHAEYSKKVAIETAKAKNESAVLDAEAEVKRASGLAKAIQIVGEMAKKYPDYRHQVFIEGFAEALREGKVSQVVYVPTEANIPILEARTPKN